MEINIITNFTRWFFYVKYFNNIKIHIISFYFSQTQICLCYFHFFLKLNYFGSLVFLLKYFHIYRSELVTINIY